MSYKIQIFTHASLFNTRPGGETKKRRIFSAFLKNQHFRSSLLQTLNMNWYGKLNYLIHWTDFCSNDMSFMILLIDNYKTNIVWNFVSYLKENQFILWSGFEVISCCWYHVIQYKWSHVILETGDNISGKLPWREVLTCQFKKLKDYVKCIYQPLLSLKIWSTFKLI